jgi:hypothetical protein
METTETAKAAHLGGGDGGLQLQDQLGERIETVSTATSIAELAEGSYSTRDGSNRLPELAARIKVEHGATATALKSGVEHAMAAGDLLLEAKALVKHGHWLPWLVEHCSISERTAQLYMRTAKHRSTIEAKIRNGVADLTLNQAAALLVLTSDVEKLFSFAKQLESSTGFEQALGLCLEQGIGYIRDEYYDPFHGRSENEKRDWCLSILFLARDLSWRLDSAVGSIEWIIQRPFQNVQEWLSVEGDRFRKRCRLQEIPQKTIAAWSLYLQQNSARTYSDVDQELKALTTGQVGRV